MSEDSVGYLLVRIPLVAVTESESWEMPEEYTYLAPEAAELVEHTIPDSWWLLLQEDIGELSGPITELSISQLIQTRKLS